MTIFNSKIIAIQRIVLLGAAISLVACTSTPRHTNVLVFGTNTKVALDVSQDATSGVGVTLGYKRMEAVWMPLLPNQESAKSGDLKPADCANDAACPKFIGQDAAGQKDTYSVLASFGSKLGGGVDADGKKAQVTGEIAQYFATGLAARLLAQSGGAGLVNTNGDALLTAKEKADIAKKVATMTSMLDDLLGDLADAGDAKKVDPAKVTAAFAKSPGKEISKIRQDRIKAVTQISDMRGVLSGFSINSVVKPMHDTLNAN